MRLLRQPFRLLVGATAMRVASGWTCSSSGASAKQLDVLGVKYQTHMVGYIVVYAQQYRAFSVCA